MVTWRVLLRKNENDKEYVHTATVECMVNTMVLHYATIVFNQVIESS